MPINAVIWDFDGTLVDTSQKNLNVTKKILERVNGTDVSALPVLQNLEVYEQTVRKVMNWQELYLDHYGLTQSQTEEAGRLWTEYQLQDKTPTPFYDGIGQVIRNLQDLPQGIFSQNTRHNISTVLQNSGLQNYFQSIVGYEEVEQAQKPKPDGIIYCLKELDAMQAGLVFYVGDHEVDATCAANANAFLEQSGVDLKILSIGAFYGNPGGDGGWQIKPDLTARHAAEIVEIVQGYR